jgi:hypothetical protein
MSTIGDAVTRTKRLLNSNTRTELDAIHTAITASSDTIRLKYQTDGIRAGSYISVGDNTQGYETMYVYARNGEYATVQRGADGSAALAFTADIDDANVVDTTIEVEPRFSGFQILEAVRDSIRALPDNLYGTSTITTSVSSTTDKAINYDFSTTGFLYVLQALRTPRAGEDRWLRVNVKVYKNSNTTDFPSGYALVIQEPLEKAVTLQLTYAHPFVTGTLNLNTLLESTIKMSDSMQDIPSLGAAASLVLSEESTRLDLHAAGDSRSDAAVAAGDRARYSLVLQAQYDRRISQEARRLMAEYGVRMDAAVSSVFPTTLR